MAPGMITLELEAQNLGVYRVGYTQEIQLERGIRADKLYRSGKG
jgi:hypothetical protein